MGEIFVLHKYMYEALLNLNKKDFIKAFKSIAEYSFYGKEPNPEDHISISVLELVRETINADNSKFEKYEGRHTQKYNEWRIKVYERDDFTCQKCGKKGGDLNAHHIKPYAKYPKLRYDLSNGVTLCKKCHKEIHGK